MKTSAKSTTHSNRKPLSQKHVVIKDRLLIDCPQSTYLLSESSVVSPADCAIIQDLINWKKAKLKQGKALQSLFLSLGLCLSLLMVIAAFEWKFYDRDQLVDLANADQKIEEFLDVPLTEQPPPPPPKLEQPQVIEVPNDEEIVEDIQIDLDVEVNQETKIETPVVEVVLDEAPLEEKSDEIFTIVENQPQPEGGFADFYAFVGDNLKYPDKASRMGIEGKVFVQFVVEKDGSLTDLQVVKGIGAGCDEEAVRVISKAPNWNPGKQRGQPVRVRMIFPIVFKLYQN
ncbi:MAG: energy transducer TonB [Candidatus Cyclobacteriaceae bacterium M3_2C_046]